MSAKTQINPIDPRAMTLVTATSTPQKLTALLAAVNAELPDGCDYVSLQPMGATLLKWHLSISQPSESDMAGAISQYLVWPISFPKASLEDIWLYSSSNNSVGVIAGIKMSGPM